MAVVNVEDVINIMQKLNSLRVKQEMSDVTVKVETTEFPCHRVILAAVSDYFYCLFTSDLWTETSRETTLENVSPETFKIILEYAYMGILHITNENAFTLLQAGDFLGMNKFLLRCIGYIEANVQVVDIFDIYLYAIHPLKKFDFARNVARNMVSKFEEITKTEKFLELTFDILKIMVEEKKHALKSAFSQSNVNNCISCGHNCNNHSNHRVNQPYCNICLRYCTPSPLSPPKPVSIKYDKIRNELVKWMNHDLIDRKKFFRQIAHLTEIPEEYIHAWESSLNCIENQNLSNIKKDSNSELTFTGNDENLDMQ